MGAPAFKNYPASIRTLIGTQVDTVGFLEKRIKILGKRVEEGINVNESRGPMLKDSKAELAKTRTNIDTLKRFFVKIKKRWSRPKDRVIGFVQMGSFNRCRCCS